MKPASATAHPHPVYVGQMPAPTAAVSIWELLADAYLVDIVPHFERFADAALDEAGVDVERIESADTAIEVADVASGPGTVSLLAAARGAVVSAIDFSPAMIAHLQQRAAARSLRVDAVVGDAQVLPWRDRRFHAAISMFGLMFFPDRAAGLLELHRVLRAGGRVVVGSWVPVVDVAILNDAVTMLLAAAHSAAAVTAPAPLSSREAVRSELEAAGFVDVDVSERSVIVPFASPTEFLQWLTRTTAPVVLMKQALGDAAFAEVFVRWNVAMMEKYGGGPLQYPLVALLGVGRRP